MQKNRNYQKELDNLILSLNGRKPRLVLHACCAPCSSYVIEYLSKYFNITILYYNPNISPLSEYDKRKSELKRLLKEMPEAQGVKLSECDYDGSAFEEMAKGMEDAPEGGERCFKCYEMRMRKAAELASAIGAEYFTTTLSLSPLKDADRINEIGEKIGNEVGVKHLPSNFKKHDGYLRSLLLSKQYTLYRQNYCGCRFSKGVKE
jgi:predicted adenine nucleotide alpha hydrolase (AANH) superfamily ATPase